MSDLGEQSNYDTTRSENSLGTGSAAPSTTVVPQSPQPPQPPQPPRSPKKRGALGHFFAGLVGGLLGACALTAILVLTGVFGNSSRTLTGRVRSGATNGQSITINASQEDATVAEAVATKCLPSVVSITGETSGGTVLGSGVLLDKDGNIITNNHVVEGTADLSVDIEGTTYDATLVGSDSSSDIAVIKADLKGASVTPIEIGDSDQLVVGDWVMTIGSPFGLDQSVSTGIVSALYRSTLLSSSSGTTIYANLIQIDAAINQGNSGGALVNDEGKLVGINTLLESTSGDFSGIGFAIPGNYAVNIANKIIAGEKVTHAYIGLSMLTVNEQNSSGLAVDEGAYVAEVVSDGPAEQAGIKQGDIVVAVDGEKISSADGVIIAIRSHEEGDIVSVTVNRDGTEKSFDVTLGNDEQLQIEQQLSQQQEEGTSPFSHDSPFEDFGQ